MKKAALICLLLAVAATIHARQNEFPKLTGPYLGQKPPGKTPEPFAAGIYNYAPYIYPDGRLLFFSRSRAKDPAKIFVSVMQKDGTWTEAKMLFDDAARPAVTPDGKYLFLARGDGITCWVEAGFIEELRTPTNGGALTYPYSSLGE